MKAFVRQFTEKFDYSLVKKIGRRYYLVNQDIREKEIPGKPFALGTFLGEEKRTFLPSPALIGLIARTSARKATVTKEAEWLFLCGRDVLPKGIISITADDGLILVQNERDENLGYGKIIHQKNGILIKNVLDKGAYLRMER
jgi:ribosome biogenesis protein Nip4